MKVEKQALVKYRGLKSVAKIVKNCFMDKKISLQGNDEVLARSCPSPCKELAMFLQGVDPLLTMK